jgi:predicted RNA-binding Zn-ribbon protein involved in translation (DUF1610 family)
MQTSKKNNKETPDLGSVFSLSFDQTTKVEVKDFLSKAESQIRDILAQRFPGNAYKQEIHDKHERLNFACPYCGDSATDNWKKRGNLYEEGFNYHCFNCNEHKQFADFLKDFDKDISPNELRFLHEQHKKHASSGVSVGKLDPYTFLNGTVIDEWSVDRNRLIQLMGYSEARGTKIETYLKKRLQMDMNRFAWHQKAQKLMIMNLNKDGTKVLGFQIRNFKAQPKYLTFKLDRIYNELLGKEVPEDEGFEYTNSISTTFGIMELDINQPITVFEGPLDAFLFSNGVATCSVKNDFPMDLPVRYMYDCDKPGKDAALKKINDGIPVFLWKKFIQESQTGINTVKKIDLTDIMVYSIRKKILLPNFNDYFSKSKYDVYWI